MDFWRSFFLLYHFFEKNREDTKKVFDILHKYMNKKLTPSDTENTICDIYYSNLSCIIKAYKLRFVLI